MKKIPLFFVSGLPRSGSTLLMNLLGQNPNFHVTPTNDLLELVLGIRNTWTNMISFKAQGTKTVLPRILGSMRGTMSGFFEEELDAGKIVFDKSRGWMAYIELIEEILGRPIKIIVTVRDIKAIVASFEKLHRKNQMTKPSSSGNVFYDLQTVEGRARQLLNVQSVAGLTITRLRDVFDRGLADRLIIVPYHQLTTNTDVVMKGLHNELGLEPFDYNPNQVEQVTHEDDSVHGMELHKIRNEIKPFAPDWNEVLTPQVCDWIDREYADINKLAYAFQEPEPPTQQIVEQPNVSAADVFKKT